MTSEISQEVIDALSEEIRMRKATNSCFYEVYSEHPAMALIGAKIELDAFHRRYLENQPELARPGICLLEIRRLVSFLVTYLEMQGCPWPDEAPLPNNVQVAKNEEVFQANFERYLEDLQPRED